MIAIQETLNLSPYMGIYVRVVPLDNMLLQNNDLVDFSFVLEELKNLSRQRPQCGASDSYVQIIAQINL